MEVEVDSDVVPSLVKFCFLCRIDCHVLEDYRPTLNPKGPISCERDVNREDSVCCSQSGSGG